ncbi:hypothetical protein NLO98_16825 [Pseudomonas syringae]|nr:hypothetical protein [Pseudomonas syringae]
MSRDIAVIGEEVAQGEMVSEYATLDARDMCSMNFAREEMKKLDKILLTFVVPAMGGYENEMACAIARHLEHIRMFSGNFCWKHRHVGAAWGEVGKRPGIDD